jgi:hypothetical protein
MPEGARLAQPEPRQEPAPRCAEMTSSIGPAWLAGRRAWLNMRVSIACERSSVHPVQPDGVSRALLGHLGTRWRYEKRGLGVVAAEDFYVCNPSPWSTWVRRRASPNRRRPGILEIHSSRQRFYGQEGVWRVLCRAGRVRAPPWIGCFAGDSSHRGGRRRSPLITSRSADGLGNCGGQIRRYRPHDAFQLRPGVKRGQDAVASCGIHDVEKTPLADGNF